MMTVRGRMPAIVLFTVAVMVTDAGFASAQQLPEAKSTLAQALEAPEVQRALDYVERHTRSTAELLVRIGSIVSPSGQESARAEAVATHMRQIGLRDVAVDSIHNAVGRIPGLTDSALVFVSTLDDLATVAEHQRARDSPLRIKGDSVIGPGSNTSATTASILAAAEAIEASGWTPRYELVFAAVAQEEVGLNGMRILHERLRHRAVAFIDVLGDGRSISYGALGIRWRRITATGPAGHTLDGGLPNVNLGIARAVDRILHLGSHDGDEDRSAVTINVAVLRSGEVFNHKPESGWFSVDFRSLDSEKLDRAETGIERVLRRVTEETAIAFEQEVVTDIPAGQIEGLARSDFVQTSVEIAGFLGLEPTTRNSGSANLNVAIANGTPALGLGGSRGGQRGFKDEWADIVAMTRSAKHVVLLAATMAGVTSDE